MTAKLGEAVCDAFETNAIGRKWSKNDEVASDKNLILEGQEAKNICRGRYWRINNAVTAVIQNLAQPETENADDPCHDMKAYNGPGGFVDGEEGSTVAPQPGQGSKFRTYTHGGRLWDTPTTFELPSDMHTFDHGWTLWIIGLPGYTIKAADGST